MSRFTMSITFPHPRDVGNGATPESYHLAKLPCSPDHLVDPAHSLASLILAHWDGPRNASFSTWTTPCGAA